MTKPYLLVVTGRPGSGKSTFARELSERLFLPVVSRDNIKEGYVHTFGKKHNELPPETNGVVNEVFLDTLMRLIDGNVSVVAEAAFRHTVWSNMLERFYEKARRYIIICKTDATIAHTRYIQRGLDNELREYFHGDKGVDMARRGQKLNVNPYDEPRLDFPTFHVDTTGAYSPSVPELGKMIFG